MSKVEKTGNKKLIKRGYDFTVNGFELTYTIRIFEAYDVEYKDEYGTFWEYEETVIDRFVMTDEDIKKEYDGITSKMWDEIKEEYGITESAMAA